MKICRAACLLFFSFCSLLVVAQTATDLSKVKASQLSDSQLLQYVNQAKSRGLSLQDVELELARRGLPPAELAELKQRIEMLGLDDKATDSASVYTLPTDAKTTQPGRKLPKIKEQNPLLLSNDEFFRKKPRLFGTELFNSTSLSFEPDLRLATPLDYVIGPDDELQLTIYGLNSTQQTIKVSPEGNINVRYAGLVNVSGLSVEAAKSVIQSRLLKYYPALRSGETKLQLTLGDIRTIRVVIIGAVMRPGTYSLPSLATLFNALYASGGPSESGSFRKIELIRQNRVIARADLYDFLLNGNLSSNQRLQDNDVVRIPFSDRLVTISGEINRPGIFEVKPEEHLSDVLAMAGGFKSSAFRGRIRGTRLTNFDKSLIDISGDSLTVIKVENGDVFVVDSLIDRFRNRVMISGAVYKPGAYSLDQGMTLKDLLSKSQGVKEDVFTGRAIIARKRADLTREFKSIQLGQVISGESVGIFLQREDSVHIASVFDLKDTMTVTVNGAVRFPGNYRFEDSLTLKSLIMIAGGYTETATGRGLEISRRKKDIQVNKAGAPIVDIIKIDDDKSFTSTAMDIPLMPFDIVTVKEDPFTKKQISVKISGEVLMPSIYTLQSREEKLSSIIARSGGLLYTANVRGAKLVRMVKDTLDMIDVKRLLTAMERDTSRMKEDTVLYRHTKDIAIDLPYILSHPGSVDDITLEDGDELIIPRINNTVNIYGEVFRPVGVMYESKKKFRDYLSDAGGVTQRGKRGRAFLIYANGGAAKTKKFLAVFPRYPKVEPGASIFVPQKPKRESAFDAGRASILVSAVTALITAVALFTR